MKKRALLFLLISAFASPAFAGVPAEIYKDVPAGHWAENAIEEVAINRNLMQGYPDYTFRGESKFSRQDFVHALRGLVQELEVISKTSWKKSEKNDKNDNNAFSDLKEQNVLSFLRDYGLFEGVLKNRSFEANHPVTRFELAKVIHNLLELAEKKKVLEPPAPPHKNPFSDLSPSDPFYSEVLGLAVSYRVMVGFPDGTFRGEEELTRYQFAAVCAQTFPLIRELVIQAMNRQNQRDPRFRLNTPLEVALRNGSGAKNFVTSLEFSGLYYPSSLFWFYRLRGGMDLDGMLAAGSPLPPFQGIQFQPYFGARGFYDGKKIDGGITGGAIVHRPLSERWGVFADVELTAGRGLFLKGTDAGFEYVLTPKSALTFGLGYWEVPASGVFDLKLGYAFGF